MVKKPGVDLMPTVVHVNNVIYFAYMQIYRHFCKMSSEWNDKVKRLLKSELVRRGFTTSDLVELLDRIGVQETKAGIDSKISRGTFSAAFLIQCLIAIGCKSFIPEISADMVEDPPALYKKDKQS